MRNVLLIASFIFLFGCSDSQHVEITRLDKQDKAPEALGPHFVTVKDANDHFPLALNGCCAVSLFTDGSWIPGDKRFGVVHRGRTFLLATPDKRDEFFQSPDTYSPALAGYDVVVLGTTGDLTDGIPEHLECYHNRLYLFSDNKAHLLFLSSPDAYAAYAALKELPK